MHGFCAEIFYSKKTFKLKGHGNNFNVMATKKRNMLLLPINVSVRPHFSATKILCCKWENMRKPTSPGTLSRFCETFFLLSNQIHWKFKMNQNILTKIFYNKMADSESMQPNQKLSDEEKQLLLILINIIKPSRLQKLIFKTRKKNQL